MSTKRIPISAAKKIAGQFDCRQVILVAWDGQRTHVVTYGVNEEECDQAAQGGNFIKKSLGWPESLCNTEPSRVKKLRDENEQLKQKLQQDLEIFIIQDTLSSGEVVACYSRNDTAEKRCKGMNKIIGVPGRYEITPSFVQMEKP